MADQIRLYGENDSRFLRFFDAVARIDKRSRDPKETKSCFPLQTVMFLERGVRRTSNWLLCDSCVKEDQGDEAGWRISSSNISVR